MPRADSFNIVDPLYGELKLTGIVARLSVVPEVQRLREVSMSNIDSLSFPSIGKISRYEHVLGVAHLASITAESLGLSPLEKNTLLAAAILHDVATPAFGHLFEELLKLKFGFDHETRLFQLLGGTGEHLNGYQPIFAGRMMECRSVFESSNYLLDYRSVCDLIRGEGRLGKLLHGPIDLDNIDNVYRIAYHMGFAIDRNAPIRLAKAFRLEETGTVALDTAYWGHVNDWQNTRIDLYQKLMFAPEDLCLKAMLTLAMEIGLAGDPPCEPALTVDDWSLTDWELIQRLLSYTPTVEIIRRLRLADLYPILGRYLIKGESAISLLKDAGLIQQIKNNCTTLLKKNVILYTIPERRYRDPQSMVVPNILNYNYLETLLGESHPDLRSVLVAIFWTAGKVTRDIDDRILSVLKPFFPDKDIERV